jgi:hypothetical protein
MCPNTWTSAVDARPFRAKGTVRYEFAIVREGSAVHHFYLQPFPRMDRLIRLLTSNPGEGLGTLVEAGERHSAQHWCAEAERARQLGWWM